MSKTAERELWRNLFNCQIKANIFVCSIRAINFNTINSFLLTFACMKVATRKEAIRENINKIAMTWIFTEQQNFSQIQTWKFQFHYFFFHSRFTITMMEIFHRIFFVQFLLDIRSNVEFSLRSTNFWVLRNDATYFFRP